MPAARARVFGRDGDVADARERLVHGDRRLITLIGTGGIGKTTLSREIARAAAPAFADGVAVVDLERLGAEDDVAAACLRALDVPDQGHEPRTVLHDLLAPRALLLILDNCEHLVQAVAALVDALLDACPDLRVLATSRVPLRVDGEVLLPVEPVAVPSPVDDPTSIADVPSVALFVDRASAASPGFRLTDTNIGDVADICRRLDGLPLAIELAAALTTSLSAGEIAERLGRADPLRLLEGGSTSPRHRTLEAALDWSHELLAPEEQVVFRRLAIFVAGWSIEGAEAVAALGGDASSVARRLGTLVEHSLVVREDVGERSRYRMLAPVADYATARLDASGERAGVALAHATFILGATSSAAPFGQSRPADVTRIEAELDDLRAALRAADAAGVLPLAAGLLFNLLVYYRIRGLLSEGLTELERQLDGLGPDPTPLRGNNLLAQADFLQVSGRYEEALHRASEGESIGVAIGDDRLRRAGLALRGTILGAQGDLTAAHDALTEALALVERDPDDASIAFAAAALGALEIRRGDLEGAQANLERALGAFEAAPSWFVGRVHTDLAVVARRRGDLGLARRHVREALAWLHDYGAMLEAILALEEAAYLAVDERDPALAATLLSAATALRDRTAVAPTDEQRAVRDAALQRLRGGLDARRFRTAWGRGRSMSLGDAVALHAASSSGGGRTRPRLPHGPELTPRERDIAGLVAQGLTNPQIAERLVLATGTVRIHVERILGKLGMTSRVQIATWYLGEGRSETDSADDEVERA